MGKHTHRNTLTHKNTQTQSHTHIRMRCGGSSAYRRRYRNQHGPTWLGRVLVVVEHQHIGGGGLGGDDALVLGHVAGSVHLPLMVDLDFYLYLPAD